MTESSSNMKFHEFCEVLESVAAAKQPKEKREILSKFFKEFKTRASLGQNEGTNDLFSLVRLLLPQLERDRSPFGVKDFLFAKKLIKMLALNPNGPDANSLLNFQAHSKNLKIKDFADAAFWVLKKRFYKISNLTIVDVNNFLNKLAENHSLGDPRAFDATLFDLFRATSAKEQKWLIRIILKDLKLGIGQDNILNSFHPDAAEFYASNSSLTRVCEVLKDSSVRLHEIEVTIFTAFRAMLSKKCDLKEFHKITTPNFLFYVENKFDGERFQIHMKNNVFKYFSRRGFEYTDTYGDCYDRGLFTPLLKNAFDDSVTSVILDGEMMGWNTKTRQFGSKGMNFDVKNLSDTSTHQPCFCVFDILLLNDKVLTNKPLKKRVQLLRNNVKEIEGVIMISKTEEATSRIDLINALNQTMDKGEEGIVFKDPNSVYKMNDRNSGWWKMKLEYFENVMSDLDVVILGGFYGSGRHRLKVRGYLVGIVTTERQFLTFAKIQSGLSDEEYASLDNILDPHWKKLGEGDPSEYGIKFGKEKPDVWIAPENSCVVLVRATELIRTTEFPTNFTLRFPRILKIRPDKPYYDCLTDKELLELTAGSKVIAKLNKRHLELEDIQVAVKKKKKKIIIQPKDLKNIEVRANILNGYEFRVLTGSKDICKDDVEKLIVENGGKVVQVEGNDTFCIISGYNDARVEFYKTKGHFCDIAKLEWLLRIINEKEFKMYGPFDLLVFCNQTRLNFLNDYDQYFDSYTENATEKSVRECVQLIQQKGHYVNLMKHEIDEFLADLSVVKS